MAVTLPYQSYTAWKVCMIILHFLAICSTILRIWIQQRTRKLWWDDYLVALPAAFDIFFCITLFVYPPIEPKSIIMDTAAFGNYWLSLFPSYTVPWLSRICFLLLLARLFPPRHVYRRVTLSLVFVFAAMYVTLLGLTIPPCDGVHLFLTANSKEMCQIPARTNPKIIFALITDLLSDTILVACPLSMLYKVKLTRPRDKPIVLISLASSALTFVLVMVLVIFNYAPFTKDISLAIVIYMLAQMTAAVSLIACNIPIVACSAYRSFRKTNDKYGAPIVEMPNASTVPDPIHADSQIPLPPLHHYHRSRIYSSGSASGEPTTEEHLTYANLTRISISDYTEQSHARTR